MSETSNSKPDSESQESLNADLEASKTSAGASAPNSTVDNETVPLGPACLVVMIFFLLLISVGFVAASVFLMGNQSGRAAVGIRDQLIPWIEESTLSELDKREVVNDLEALVIEIENDLWDERQLRRLKSRLEDNPIFQWGVVQQMLAKADQTDLTEKDLQDLNTQSLRLFHAMVEGRVGMQNMEFLCQTIATKEFKTGRLLLQSELIESDIREFLDRTKTYLDEKEIKTETDISKVPDAVRRFISDAKAVENDGKL